MKTLEDFAETAGVKIIKCDPAWGGRFAYTTKDHPTTKICGFQTQQEAYEHWLSDTFGEHASKALLELLEEST